MKSPYEDIIHLPHHVSETRGQMSMHDRAAQFSPFAALTGYDAAIAETARLTEERAELDVGALEELDRQFRRLEQLISTGPDIKLRYFMPDERKAGGAYVELAGKLKKLDTYQRLIILESGERIAMNDVVEMEIIKG